MLKKFFYIGLTLASVATATASLNSNSKEKLKAEDYIFTCEACHVQEKYDVEPVLALRNTVQASYSDFKSFYFDNLTQNFGMNYKGSCGYVSIGMMLSYYDTVLSDDIIPEKYDKNSIGTETNLIQRRNNPGIVRDIISEEDYNENGFDMSAQDYYDTVTGMENSLHGELIRVGSQLGYYNFNDDDNPAGLSIAGVINVMGNALHEFGFEFDQEYTLYGGFDSKAKPFAIEQIKKGNPVLLFIADGESGHACVGYDYNSSNDTVYCHMGWDGNYTHTSPQSVNLPEIIGAISIEFNIDYKASNNYALKKGSTCIYFSVDEINENYELVHEHHYEYSPTSSGHCRSCRCGECIVEAHSYNDHFQRYSKTQHKAYCACGTYVLRPHSVKVGSTTWNRGIMRAVCEECGALVDLGTTPVIAYQ